jgi:hypothetical protein
LISLPTACRKLLRCTSTLFHSLFHSVGGGAGTPSLVEAHLQLVVEMFIMFLGCLFSQCPSPSTVLFQLENKGVGEKRAGVCLGSGEGVVNRHGGATPRQALLDAHRSAVWAARHSARHAARGVQRGHRNLLMRSTLR